MPGQEQMEGTDMELGKNRIKRKPREREVFGKYESQELLMNK